MKHKNSFVFKAVVWYFTTNEIHCECYSVYLLEKKATSFKARTDSLIFKSPPILVEAIFTEGAGDLQKTTLWIQNLKVALKVKMRHQLQKERNMTDNGIFNAGRKSMNSSFEYQKAKSLQIICTCRIKR